MKCVAINGSTRKQGNTALLIEMVFEVLRSQGIDCELLQIGNQTIQGCTGCGTCRKQKNNQCVITDDSVNDYVKRLADSDAILLGSPTYFADVTANMKALIERLGRVAAANDSLFSHKIGASIVAVKRAGGIHAFNTLNNFFLVSNMVVVGSCYWNVGFGGAIGEVQQDRTAQTTMETLGKNIAWLMKKLDK